MLQQEAAAVPRPRDNSTERGQADEIATLKKWKCAICNKTFVDVFSPSAFCPIRHGAATIEDRSTLSKFVSSHGAATCTCRDRGTDNLCGRCPNVTLGLKKEE
ncbi:hypothetical protein J6590_043332 [Homalodisca vitripennis]|nr:hypothetical protein J6590_043332 [Homalodisca vitripennis]